MQAPPTGSVTAAEPRFVRIAPDHPRRPEVERDVARTYRVAHGARLHDFLPHLFVVAASFGRAEGVIGAHVGGDHAGPFFLEQYLQAPIEQVLEQRLGVTSSRSMLAEVGSLAAVHAQGGRMAIAALAAWLDGAAVTRVVCTATTSLRVLFARAGLDAVELARADVGRLQGGASDWGRYYEADPRVIALSIDDVRRHCDRWAAPLVGYAYLAGLAWARGRRSAAA